jgi:hypothetical protein
MFNSSWFHISWNIDAGQPRCPHFEPLISYRCATPKSSLGFFDRLSHQPHIRNRLEIVDGMGGQYSILQSVTRFCSFRSGFRIYGSSHHFKLGRVLLNLYAEGVHFQDQFYICP